MDFKTIQQRPLLMGIVNCTPDSFFSPSRIKDQKNLFCSINEMIHDGANWIDVGGCSTRPNSSPPPLEEEWERIHHALDFMRKEYPQIPLSVDTFRAEIAKRSMEEYDVQIINDISGGKEGMNMFPMISQKKNMYVLTYNDVSLSESNPKSIVEKAKKWFSKKIREINNQGVKKIILDLGFGFSKTLEENYQLLAHLEEFKTLGYPILVGISRKSMIYNLLHCTPEEALNGTTIVHTFALLHGADILRVHDVKPAREALLLCEKLKQLKNN